MTISGWIQIASSLAVVAAFVILFGGQRARVFEGRRMTLLPVRLSADRQSNRKRLRA